MAHPVSREFIVWRSDVRSLPNTLYTMLRKEYNPLKFSCNNARIFNQFNETFSQWKRRSAEARHLKITH